jgi:hypothetical protein
VQSMALKEPNFRMDRIKPCALMARATFRQWPPTCGIRVALLIAAAAQVDGEAGVGPLLEPAGTGASISTTPRSLAHESSTRK